MAASARKGRPRPSNDDNNATSRPGVGVDAQGGQVVDPTKNVEALVKALEDKLTEFRTGDNRFLDAEIASLREMMRFTREADTRFNDFARVAGEKFQNALSAAETTRVNELAQTRQEFQNTIRDMLAKSVETTSTLVSNQLLQIQATFDKRVSDLEAKSFTQAGRSSVSDPALSEALTSLAHGLTSLRSQQDDSMAKMMTAFTTMQQAHSASGGALAGKQDAAATQRANLALFVSAGGVVALVALHFLH